MSIFSAFGVTDVAAVQTDPFKIPRNRYSVLVSGAEVKKIKEVDYFIVELTIADTSSEHDGKNANNMLRIQPWLESEVTADQNAKTLNARTIGSYKKALLELGISETMLDQFDPRTMGTKLLGIRGTADIGPNKNGYNTVFEFTREVTAASPQATAEATQAVSSPAVDASALDALMGNL